MQGILREGEELLQKKGQIDDVVLDAGLVAAAQKVEHYEISTYGTLREFARVLQAGACPVYAPRDEPWGMRSSMIADPEGNLVEIGSWNRGA